MPLERDIKQSEARMENLWLVLFIFNRSMAIWAAEVTPQTLLGVQPP